MKKIISIGLLCFSPLLLATETRVATLGGETSMLTKDDTNIDLFPQRINDWEILRITNIQQTGAPNTGKYAAVMGKRGDKWGIYGSQNERSDLINVYKSLGKNKAIKAGVTLSTDKGNDGTTKTEYTNIGINATLGIDSGDSEIAYTGVYAKDPASSPVCTGAPAITNPVTGIAACGKATPVAGGPATSSKSYNELFFRADYRTPKKIAMFRTLYANAFLDRISAKTRTGGTDNATKATFLGAEALLFNKKTINKTDLLVYGLGAGVQYGKSSIDNAGVGGDVTSFLLGAIKLRLGLESDIKYGVLRFGITRDITLYSSVKDRSGGPGTTDDTSGIGKDGNYEISTGWGFTYNNLKIDIKLNSIFWTSGPQMIFDNSAGSIGTQADIVYSF